MFVKGREAGAEEVDKIDSDGQGATFIFSCTDTGALDQTLNHVLKFNLSVYVSCLMWCMNCTVLD